MTKREAKNWACSMAADLLVSDLAMGQIVPEDDPDHDKKKDAFDELINELRRRGGNQ